MPRLRHANDREPGIRRIRAGRGFRYLDALGKAIGDRDTLARIRALAVPPAYEHVWICADANGHLQATGYDARGRKQYRYHPQWRVLRDAGKFLAMIDFARALPALRRRVRRDLRLPGLPREKIIAAVVRLLDLTGARIGNGAYARQNGSYGLSTLRQRHARLDGGAASLRLRFRGKGGKVHALAVDDDQLARIVRRCQQLPGQLLFQYIGEDGDTHAVDSRDVNDYLHDSMGEEFSAKDFRSWAATLLAAARLQSIAVPRHGGERAMRRCIGKAVQDVATHLRNTPTVCRRSYINPSVFVLWRCGDLQRERLDLEHAPRAAERVLLRLLRRQQRHGRGRRSS